MPSDTGEASGNGAAFRLLVLGAVLAVGSGLVLTLAPGDGVIAGNRLDALPAPMSVLAWPFRAGIGPSGSTARGAASAFGEAWAEFFAFLAFLVSLAFLAFLVFLTFLVFLALLAGVEAAVTAVVSAAAGGVHFAVVTTLAVTVSFTEVTDVAVDATGIWACRLAGCSAVREPMLHKAVPSSVVQPLVNVGFWLDGCALSVTDTW